MASASGSPSSDLAGWCRRARNVDVTPVVEPVSIVDGDEGGALHERRRKKKKKKKKTKRKVEEVAALEPVAEVAALEPVTEVAEPRRKKRKRRKIKKEENAPEPELVQSVESADCTESVKLGKDFHASEEPEGEVEVCTWVTHKQRPSLVYGGFSAAEDAALKQAIFDYVRAKRWERDEGVQKILHSRANGARGCWSAIGKCLPRRELRSLYDRAHRLLGADTRLGKWTSAEVESLRELHQEHGNQWTKISNVIGRDPTSCCIKWARLKSDSLVQKTGRWSQEEKQKLRALVLECLHERRQMARKGQLAKPHRRIRDNINWVHIAKHMEGRSRYQCSNQWYDRLSKSVDSSVES